MGITCLKNEEFCRIDFPGIDCLTGGDKSSIPFPLVWRDYGKSAAWFTRDHKSWWAGGQVHEDGALYICKSESCSVLWLVSDGGRCGENGLV